MPPRRSPGVQVALAANSPFLFGRQLWQETRITLFEQATDTRPAELKEQGVRPRVWFGERWITSVFDLFEENIRYFPALLPICEEEDPLAVLESGAMPAAGRDDPAQRDDLPLEPAGLRGRGRPAASAGGEPGAAGRPSVADVMANAAFYYGLVRSLAEAERPIWTQMSFATAADNLHEAARLGLGAHLYWPGVGEVPVAELVLRRLLPLAREGLRRWNVSAGARRPAAGHHRAALPDRSDRRGLADRHGRGAHRARGGRAAGGAAADDPALYRAHARQRAGAHLAAALLRPGGAARPLRH